MDRMERDKARLRFNKAQLELIRSYSALGLKKATGMVLSQCKFLRANKPTDYRFSTLQRLCAGLGISLVEFLQIK
jgi:DNA-binding Xre family transcriptional regulator